MEGGGGAPISSGPSPDSPAADCRLLLPRWPCRCPPLQLAYCGICHSDLHKLRNEWKAALPPTTYPCVAGHEMIGVVTAVGPQVVGFKVGDRAAVGCMVGSCGR